MSRVKENQAGIRTLPITAKLKAQLEYAAEKADVDVDVFSGGQISYSDARKLGAKKIGKDWWLNGEKVRTGSTRHDNGNAADVFLWKDGRKLSANNREDAEIMKLFVVEAIRAGVTGVGHANDYMGPQAIHLGGGTTAVWGKTGGIPSNMISRAFKEGLAARKKSPVKL